ncbi:hypothetical protein D9756_004422 [Leucocoprinus leucothites]|uniref:Nephrocystin 3-like N-terminal domain-containing protein n=1 Tax=Leucocoprinus leucothites TaxID=201217 RepID=A0A8H5D8S6_9AGAR|nr:hypothetical protein D9756_004422 [Leucoagaricus leucothites]
MARRVVNPDGAGSQARPSVPQRPPAPLSTEDIAPLSQPTTITAPAPTPVPSLPTTSSPALPGVEPPNTAHIPAPSPSPTPIPPLLTSSPAVLSPTPASQPQHYHAQKMFHKAQGFTINNSQFIDASHADSDYIDLITNWALGKSDRKEPILWMCGPFGIGKSAVAQSCAEALVLINKLAATLFFSRSNADHDDPRHIFTSIAYQIATKCPSFQEIIDRCMIKDPALATKSLSMQFEVLLVEPLGQLDIAQSGLADCVVIIDGLDECCGTEGQCEIIKIIAASIRKHTMPFHWFITSRPEDPIIRTMDSPAVSPVHSRIELPVSHVINHQILVYLTDEFKLIREDHGLPKSWPSEEVLALLVERGAGLWIYVATIVCFIKDENSLGPEDQLCIVLKYAKGVPTKVRPDNLLAEMDFFYTLIMERLPLKVRTVVRNIFLAYSMLSARPMYTALALCLSAEQFHCACASIQSVMGLKGSDLESLRIKFYHTSFLDFIKDPQWSKDLCIHDDFLIGCRQKLLKWLHETAMSLVEFPFKKMLRLLPAELCNKIIQKGKCPIPECMNTRKVWILGYGENETIPEFVDVAGFKLRNNQDVNVFVELNPRETGE